MTPEFWLAVGQIIMIDILLGGDNAVVIALACRTLPEAQRRAGILWGTAGAIGPLPGGVNGLSALARSSSTISSTPLDATRAVIAALAASK